MSDEYSTQTDLLRPSRLIFPTFFLSMIIPLLIVLSDCLAAGSLPIAAFGVSVSPEAKLTAIASKGRA